MMYFIEIMIKVVEAYMNPAVDHSLESFEWNRPNLDGLRSFATRKFGWDQERVSNSNSQYIIVLNPTHSIINHC